MAIWKNREQLMAFNRQFGLLLHPTSLPSEFGIGDIGPTALEFVTILHEMGASLWQILPVNNPGYGQSPYSADSVFAANPLLISPELLYQNGWLTKQDILNDIPSSDQVDFKRCEKLKNHLFRKSFNTYIDKKGFLSDSFQIFRHDNHYWLENYAIYKAIKNSFDGRSWLEWPIHLKMQDPEQISAFKKSNEQEILYQIFLQFIFFSQWQELKSFAVGLDIAIIGDMPIFPALDSADVWSNSSLFDLKEDRHPVSQAGVPPDYFSSTGQKWGNPLYNWSENKRTDYSWWKERFRVLLKLVDMIRIDHFRGFEKYWCIPADAVTAEIGEWKPGPGAEFFTEIKHFLGSLPFIAEDLGIITPEVEELRDYLGFPGMRILQFAFDGNPANPYLLFNHRPQDVVFTGSHDNNTTRGWWDSLEPDLRSVIAKQMETILGHPIGDIVVEMLRMVMSSVCHAAIIPVQDLLGLNASTRMNTPGTSEGNWKWKLKDFDALQNKIGEIRQMASIFNRVRNDDQVVLGK